LIFTETLANTSHLKFKAKAGAKAPRCRSPLLFRKGNSVLGGGSPQNIWRMRQFFETYRDQPILSPLLRELPWSSNLHILSRSKPPEEREFCQFHNRKRIAIFQAALNANKQNLLP
jgi:hypothetical protein